MMRRFLCVCLAFLVFLCSFSCSSDPHSTQTDSPAGTEEASDPESRYRLAASEMKNLSHLHYLTKVTDPQGKVEKIETLQVKEGYGTYRYQREGEREKVYYLNRTAYVIHSLGSFTSECSDRVFDEYRSKELTPFWIFETEWLLFDQGEGDLIRYHVKSEEIHRFAGLGQEGFSPASVRGEAKIGSKGEMIWEKLWVKGLLSGKEVEFSLETEPVSLEGSHTVTVPQGSFQQVGDFRLPKDVERGLKLLEQKDKLQATLFLSCSGVLNGESRSYYRECSLIWMNSAEMLLYSREMQSDGMGERGILSQLYRSEGVRNQYRYDAFSGELLQHTREETEQKEHWIENLTAYLPLPQEYASLTADSQLDHVSVSFSLTEEGKMRFLSELGKALGTPSLFAESENLVAEGVFGLSSKTGLMTAFSLSFRGESEGEPVNTVFSFVLEQEEPAILPPWAPPAPLN